MSTSFVDVFGGQTVPPAEEAYVAHSVSADVELVWSNNYAGVNLLAAAITEISASVASLVIKLPPANLQSVGVSFLLRNTGAHSFSVTDNAGGAVTVVPAGQAKYLYVTNNTTAAGQWSVFTYGTGTSGADATLLAGAGLQASGNTLQTQADYSTLNSDYTVSVDDRAKLFDVVSGSVTVTMPAAATAGSGFYVYLRNSSSGSVLVKGSGVQTVDSVSSKTLAPGESAIFVCNGIAWVTVGYGRSAVFAFSELVLNAALPTVTLTSDDVTGRMLRVSGVATQNIEVILPSVNNIYFTNVGSGMGVYSVTFKTALVGSSITLSANQSTVLYCDGTNITTGINFIQVNNVALGDGSAGAPTLNFALDTDTGLFRSGSGTVGITSNGQNVLLVGPSNLVPGADNNYDLGSAARKFKNLYVAGSAEFGGTTVPLGKTLVVTTDKLNALASTSSAELANVINDETGSGPLVFANSPVLTGTPTAPTAAPGTNTTQLATTAHVIAERAAIATLTNKTVSGGTVTGAVVTGLPTPTLDTDAASKAYVDNVAQGLDVKTSVVAATTGDITLSGTQTVDGVALTATQRVLVKNQTISAQNGVYAVSAGAWTRTTDANTWNELVSAFVFVSKGTVNSDSGWVCTVDAGGTLGTTPVDWSQFAGAGAVVAGAGLTKTGNELNVISASSTRIVVNANDIDLATTGVAAGTYRSVTVDSYGRTTGGTNPTTVSGYGLTDVYTKTEVDSSLSTKLGLSGGTLSGVLDTGGNAVSGLPAPVLDNDAVRLKYITDLYGSTASAAASASAAAISAADAATTLDSFDDRYLGAKVSPPSVDNDSNPLITGALYFNTSDNQMYVYTGSAWLAVYLPAAGYVTLTGAETLTNKTISYADNTLTGVQPTLVSGTSIKTINGDSVLGSGNIAVVAATSGVASSLTLNDGYTEEVYELTGTDFNVTNGSIQYKTLFANTTFTESMTDGQSLVLMLNPGTFLVTWPTITWIKPEGATWTAPPLKASVYNAFTMFQFSGVLYGRFDGSV